MRAITIIGLLWVFFTVYWAVSALGVKRSVRDDRWWRTAAIRLIFAIVVVLLIRRPQFRAFMTERSLVAISPVIEYTGVLLCALGLAFAIWARVHLGRNWGMPMSARVEPELITSGPYRFVRHPIYTGIIAALFGSSLVAGPIWMVAFVVWFAFFVFSASKEEAFLMERFPQEYPEYKRRTKMLIPFIW